MQNNTQNESSSTVVVTAKHIQSEQDIAVIASLKHITSSLISEYLEDHDDHKFIFNNRPMRNVNRVQRLIFPFIIRMVEHHLSAYTGKKQDNFLFEFSHDKKVGNIVEVVGINPKNEPMFMLVSSALVFVFNTYFKEKAHRIDLNEYISSINQ